MVELEDTGVFLGRNFALHGFVFLEHGGGLLAGSNALCLIAFAGITDDLADFVIHLKQGLAHFFSEFVAILTHLVGLLQCGLFLGRIRAGNGGAIEGANARLVQAE